MHCNPWLWTRAVERKPFAPSHRCHKCMYPHQPRKFVLRHVLAPRLSVLSVSVLSVSVLTFDCPSVTTRTYLFSVGRPPFWKRIKFAQLMPGLHEKVTKWDQHKNSNGRDNVYMHELFAGYCREHIAHTTLWIECVRYVIF